MTSASLQSTPGGGSSMTTSASSPSGFSYAQAARGRGSGTASQTPSSKVTSGTATPAMSTAPDLASGATWADELENPAGNKSRDSKPDIIRSNSNESKDLPSESSKVADKPMENVSAEPSDANGVTPAPTSASSTSKEDEVSTPTINGGGRDSSSDAKSQASEPAWIAERKERQNGANHTDDAAKTEMDSNSGAVPTPPKPAVLLESAPPTVNPWLKRAEENKAKMAVTPKPASSATSTEVFLKENQAPKPDNRRQDDTSGPPDAPANVAADSKRNGVPPGKRAQENRSNGARPTRPGPAVDSFATNGPSQSSWAIPTERKLPVNALPPSVKDEASWPTPDTILEKERKDSIEKESEEKVDEDTTPAQRRKKQEWKVMPVVPNVIWETASMNENKERRPRGPPGERGRGGVRGRGGFRGGANGVPAGDRAPSKTGAGSTDADIPTGARGRTAASDRESMPPPPKPARAVSANDHRSQAVDGPQDRRWQSVSEEKKSADTFKTENPAAKSFSENRRTRSPKKLNSTVSEVKEDEEVPKPIPRRNSVDGPTDATVDNSKGSGRDTQAPRVGPTEGRKDSRTFDTTRDPSWTGPSRGAKRNSRGRGGNGNGNRGPDLANGHPTGNGYGNGFPADFVNPAQFTVPPSPSAYNGPRGGQFNYPPPGRGGWPRGNARSQSIPVDNNFYGRYPSQYGPQGIQLAPIQTFGPNMYDYGAYPMTAVPYQPYMDQTWLLDMLGTQLDYYFSIENLAKDLFLRKHMDSQGFVFVDVIANFNRIKQLTQDRDMIKVVCMNSEQIEIRVGEDGKERLRRREGWAAFVLPTDQRETTAQTDGPQQLHHPDRPQLFMSPPAPVFRGPASAGLSPPQQRGERNASYPMMNGYANPFGHFGPTPDAAHSEPSNGEEFRGRTVKSPVHAQSSTSHHLSVSADEEQNVEPDAFPDEQANVLTVVVKMSAHQRVPFHSSASRTFSNGSIDSKSILAEAEKLADTPGPSSERSGNAVNGDDSHRSLSRQTSPNKSTSEAGQGGASEMQFFWVKDQEGPVDNLPSGLTSEPYVQLRLKALDQRNHAATGTCPYDLDVLYQFWCHFLLRNFNNRMYSEFKYYANEDARERHNLTGLHSLIKFYSQALHSHSPIRERVVRDYVALVKNEPPKLEGAAFKQLRSAWRNGALNLKNRKKMSDVLDDEIKAQLDRSET